MIAKVIMQHDIMAYSKTAQIRSLGLKCMTMTNTYEINPPAL